MKLENLPKAVELSEKIKELNRQIDRVKEGDNIWIEKEYREEIIAFYADKLSLIEHEVRRLK